MNPIYFIPQKEKSYQLIDMTKNNTLLYTACFFISVSLLATFLNIHALNAIKDTEKQLIRLEQSAGQNFSINQDHYQSLKRSGKQYPAVDQSEKTNQLHSRRENIERLKKIIQSTGLETLAEINSSHPGILQEIIIEQMGEIVESPQPKTTTRVMKYYEKVPEYKILYEKSRGLHNVTEEEQEQALDKLIEKYPDGFFNDAAISSYVTKMLIKNDIQRAEKYYSKSMEVMDERSKEIYGQSMEIELVYKYCMKGDTVKLNNMLDTLETKYPGDTLVSNPVGNRSISLSELTDLFRRIGNAR